MSSTKTTTQSTNAFDNQVGGDHYKNMKIQPIEFGLANGLDTAQGACIKYICRHKHKNGRQDLIKAKHVIDLMIAFYYPGENDD